MSSDETKPTAKEAWAHRELEKSRQNAAKAESAATEVMALVVFALRDEQAADAALEAWADAHLTVLAWGVTGKPELVRATDETRREDEP